MYLMESSVPSSTLKSILLQPDTLVVAYQKVDPLQVTLLGSTLTRCDPVFLESLYVVLMGNSWQTFLSSHDMFHKIQFGNGFVRAFVFIPIPMFAPHFWHS